MRQAPWTPCVPRRGWWPSTTSMLKTSAGVTGVPLSPLRATAPGKRCRTKPRNECQTLPSAKCPLRIAAPRSALTAASLRASAVYWRCFVWFCPRADRAPHIEGRCFTPMEKRGRVSHMVNISRMRRAISHSLIIVTNCKTPLDCNLCNPEFDASLLTAAQTPSMSGG